MPLISVTAQIKGEADQDLIARLTTPIEANPAIRKVMQKYARVAQREATQNVSNRQVNFEGSSFVIKRQTGNLARSIQVTEVTALTATIVASGGGDKKEDYAAAVEEGHREFDMKPFLMGKTVPLMVSKGTPGAMAVPQVATTGRVMGNKFIIFRKVGPNSKGWIIPAMAARPFMAAAGAAVAEPFGEAVAEAIRVSIEGGSSNDATT